jgi:hypothetical protein
MAVLTQIVAAEEHEVEAIGESLNPVEVWSGIELRDVDTGKIATLDSLLTGDLFDDALARYEPIYVSMAEGALVLRLTDEAVARLSELDEDALLEVAAELAATVEFETAGWEAEAIDAFVVTLAELSRLAESQGQSIFVWMHPLQT